MSLLTALLANPLDAGYEHYRAEHGSRPASVRGKIAVFGVAVALGFGSIVATSSLRAPAGDVKSDLKSQASERTAAVEALNDEVQSLGRAIDQYSQTGSTAPSNPAQDLMTATTPVSGPGITVTLTDRSGTGKGNGNVRDQDLAMVVNAMWAAGADAVSINGQRVGPETFVRTAGSVILVNVTPVSSPYEVAAIGDANALSVALVRGATGDYLSAAQSVTGMTVSTKVSDNLQMEALTLTDSHYATPVGGSNEGGSS
jgi:putative membrane associated protein